MFKLVIIGDSAVGKSSLLLRFSDDKFSDNYISTIGVDFKFKTLHVDDAVVKLQIWDTAGQERFKTITSTYYRGADAAIIVFDRTKKETFMHLSYWIDEVSRFSDDILKLLVGNKTDETEQIEVSDELASEFTQQVGLRYVETSALTAQSVQFVFESISRELIKRQGSLGEKKGNRLSVKPGKKRKCCSRSS